jgi:hypothetical protein
MRLLTEDADLRCDHHTGRVKIVATQSLVTVEGRRVLVESDPEGRPIKGCANVGPVIKPCQLTLKVKTGYSDLLRIEGQRICLDTVRGLTEGTPPGVVHYKVVDPGQSWVEQF